MQTLCWLFFHIDRSLVPDLLPIKGNSQFSCMMTSSLLAGGDFMKKFRLLVRELAALAALMCVSFLCAQAARGQNSFAYPPFPNTSAAGLQTNGNASIVTPLTGSNFLQLTPNATYQVSSAWYTNPGGSNPPTTLSLATGFTTTFTFQFTQQGGYINPTNNTAGADGIAFVVQNGYFTNDGSSGVSALGPSDGNGGETGFFGLTNSVAVQFDTYCNTDYGDTCATNDPYSSADQITVESCGANANTVVHSAGCSFGTVDLSVLQTPIYLADGNVHTAQISYSPPANLSTLTSSQDCPVTTAAIGATGCGTITILLDGQTVLIVPFNLAYLSLDSNDDAYVGFTSATGGSYETQDVLTWNFMAGVTSAVVQPVTIPSGTGGSINLQANFGSTNGTGPTLTTDILYTAPSTTITTYPGVTNPLILSTNDTFQSSTWPEYVVGTPWATSQCTVKAANGGSTLCSLYTNACYQSGASPTTASDAYCPTITSTTEPENYILLEDTFDWGTGKWPPAPGVTASLIAFSVPTSNPNMMWGPSTGTTNSICPTQTSTSSSTCYLTDTLIDVFGDQTTTRGSKPKSKAWLVSAVNVAMPTTTINVTGTNCLPPGPNVWNNGACVLDFVVVPAGGSTSTPSVANNYFQAAQPAFIEYGFLPGTPTPPAPALGPGGLPSGDVSITNPNAVLTCNATTTICSATSWDTGLNASLQSIFGSSNGTFTLHWSAKDTAGITEKNIQLNPETGGVCPTPNGNVTASSGSQCYTTSYYTTQVNIDSTAPVITGYSFSPAGSPTGTFGLNQTVYPTYNCTDNLSGLATCGGVPVTGCPLTASATSTTPISTSTPGAHSYSVTATDCASNTSASTTVSYTVASPADVAIIGGATSDTAKSITYVAAVLDLTQGTSAYGTVITFQITDPKSSVGGPITGVFADVSCSLLGCSELPSGPMACSTSGDTVTCNVGTLPSIFQLKGAVAQITIPVVAKPQSNATIGITATVSSDDDPNPKNNSTSVTVSVK
jgi:hypothetical protein